MHFDQRLNSITDDENDKHEYFDERLYTRSKRHDLWQALNPQLYTVFWYMNLQQLVVPEEIYQD